MEDREILLRIRRTLSKNEKYRFLLKYLDNTETQLFEERKKHTELLKEHSLLKQTIDSLKSKIKSLELKVEKFTLLESQGNFIPTETHQKVCSERNQFRKKYHEQVEANIELQHQIEKLRHAI